MKKIVCPGTGPGTGSGARGVHGLIDLPRLGRACHGPVQDPSDGFINCTASLLQRRVHHGSRTATQPRQSLAWSGRGRASAVSSADWAATGAEMAPSLPESHDDDNDGEVAGARPLGVDKAEADPVCKVEMNTRRVHPGTPGRGRPPGRRPRRRPPRTTLPRRRPPTHPPLRQLNPPSLISILSKLVEMRPSNHFHKHPLPSRPNHIPHRGIYFLSISRHGEFR